MNPQVHHPQESIPSKQQEVTQINTEGLIRFCDTTSEEREEYILKLIDEEGSIDAFRIANNRYPNNIELKALKKIQEDNELN